MPRAETEKDLQAEREIVAAILARYSKSYDGWKKISEFGYRLDGVLTKRHAHGYDEVKLWYEAKDRYIRFAQYPTGFMIGFSKVVAARALTSSSNMRSLIFARFNDGVVATCDFAHYTGGPLQIGGRDDREAFRLTDEEPVALFAWSKFNIVVDPRQRAA